MSCAACSARVEKAVSKVEGVRSCSVSLLTNSMGVEGSASPADVIAAVKAAGYGASLKKAEKKKSASDADDELADTQTPALLRRLIVSLVFWIVLMYVSMGHMMWGFPLPSFFSGNHVAMGLLQLLLTVIIMVINQKFFVSGAKSLLHLAPNMDALVSLGAAAAFIYSTVSLFAMTAAQTNGDIAAVEAYMDEFYFESAATILTLITLGKTLEARSKGKTTNALKSLMRLSPKSAVIIRDGKEESVPVEEVKVGDIFVVRAGESIPVDGIILEGESALDESTLTGESIPVDKTAGDRVFSGTMNTSGYLRCEATKVGEDTTLSQIIAMVSDAAATKAPIARIADKVSGVFVPAVIGIALVTTVVWLAAGRDAGFALARGISVLVISCPCALGLATPVAIMVGSGLGAKNGILFKTAASLETTGRAKIVALDKTGTITKGEPHVTDIFAPAGRTESSLTELAYALEKKSEHPLAKAVIKKAEEDDIALKEVTDFRVLPGNGLSGTLDGGAIYGGSYDFIGTKVKIPDEAKEAARRFAEEGKTPLLFSREDEFCGIIAVADVIKEDSPAAVRELKNMGVRVVMLTGDNARTARAIGEKVGVDEVIAGVLPDGKESVIKELMKDGKTVMVGDGINDAPALTSADIGMAIGAGTDVAVDAADVVLVKNRLSDVPAAIRIGRATLRNIHENLFWAFIYNVMGIPLAAGVFIPASGLSLNPMFAAAAMSLSSFFVVTNALRLNLFNIRGTKKTKEKNNENKTKEERKDMEKTLKIEGMMCSHCEATVKKALEGVDGVKEANVSHTDGTAVVKLGREVPDEVLKKAVEDKDYKVVSIK